MQYNQQSKFMQIERVLGFENNIAIDFPIC